MSTEKTNVEVIDTTDLLKHAFEPRRKFRYIFQHERISSYFVHSVDLSSRDYVTVRFFDTDEDRTFEQLLLDMYDQHASVASYKTLGPTGGLLSEIQLGHLSVVSVKPETLDYASNDPLIFEAVFQRRDA